MMGIDALASTAFKAFLLAFAALLLLRLLFLLAPLLDASPDFGAIFTNESGVEPCTSRSAADCGTSAVEPWPGSLYTGFWPFDKPFRHPRPGPGAPRVLRLLRRFADGRASSSSSESVAATAAVDPPCEEGRRTFNLRDPPPVWSASLDAATSGEATVSASSSSTSSDTSSRGEDIAATLAGTGVPYSDSDASDTASSLLRAPPLGTRSRTLNEDIVAA